MPSCPNTHGKSFFKFNTVYLGFLKIKEPPMTLTKLGARCREMYTEINELTDKLEKAPSDN